MHTGKNVWACTDRRPKTHDVTEKRQEVWEKSNPAGQFKPPREATGSGIEAWHVAYALKSIYLYAPPGREHETASDFGALSS